MTAHQPIQRDTDDPIGKLRPWEPESKLALRRRLNNAAVLAAARATRAKSPHARQQLWLAHIAAAEWTFAVAAEEQLADALKALNYSVLGANWYERIGAGL